MVQHLAPSGPHLFEGLEDISSLAEVLKDELQGSRHQRRVVLHDEVDEDP